MNTNELQSYIFPALVIAFFAWRYWVFKKNKALIPGYLQKGAVIIDVRSASEFAQACNPISKNIPVGELPKRLKELDKSKPVILCCASGNRSGAAMGILKSNGFADVINAGPWTNTLT
jgi:phage shock protein E